MANYQCECGAIVERDSAHSCEFTAKRSVIFSCFATPGRSYRDIRHSYPFSGEAIDPTDPAARAALAMEAAINEACVIIETADARLLAADGPCGNLPPDMTLDEWRRLYDVLNNARIAARTGEAE